MLFGENFSLVMREKYPVWCLWKGPDFFRKRRFDTEKLLVCLSVYFWGLVVLLSVLLYFSPISSGVHLLYVVWFWIYVCYRVRVSNHCVSPQKSYLSRTHPNRDEFFFLKRKTNDCYHWNHFEQNNYLNIFEVRIMIKILSELHH